VTFMPRPCLLFLAFSAAILALPARAQDAGNDDTLRRRIQDGLADESLNVGVDVKDRAVVLSGTVPSAWAAKRALDVAKDAAGDPEGKVVSRITVADAKGGDRALAQAVADALAAHPDYDVFDSVSVRAERGVVILSGSVTGPAKGRDLADRALRVSGVQEVATELQPISASPLDVELRLRLANEIYNDPAFVRYAVEARPPIHIVVDRGRVTLTGTLASEVERAKALAIARGLPGAFAVDDQLRVEK
jgi:hyperosmotically inducible protein